MKRVLALFVAILACAIGFAYSPRQVIPFNTGWLFKIGSETTLDLTREYAVWEPVRLPHVWNTEQSSENYRGAGWYMKDFTIPSAWRGRRVFVRFGAASGDTMANLPDVMRALDLVSLNFYPGWYGGKLSDIAGDIDRYNRRYGSRGVAVSEFGAGASIHQHEQGMTARPYVWGSFLGVLFDFPSAGRHEGDADSINDKGLVTRDRQTKKDAYYFYKANWTDAPMVYIASRRDTMRKSAVTAIKVYSNCSKVAVKVNCEPVGPIVAAGEHVFRVENATLKAGENEIEVEGSSGGRLVRDSCHWAHRL